MLLCLLTHERRACRTMLTPLLNGDATIVEAGDEIFLTLGPFTYQLFCLLNVNVLHLDNAYNAELAAVYAHADLVHSDPSSGTLSLYRFHEHTLQVSGCVTLSDSYLADLRLSGVFARFYMSGAAAEGKLTHVVLTFPLETRVQELAMLDEEDGPVSAFGALMLGLASSKHSIALMRYRRCGSFPAHSRSERATGGPPGGEGLYSSRLSRLSPRSFASVMAHALLVAGDYLEGLGGYAEGEDLDGPENLVAAVVAEIRRRGLESGYREDYLSESDGATALVQPEDLFVGQVALDLTGLAAMRQRRTLTLEAPTTRSAVEALAKDSAGNHSWDYQGMIEETIEVELPD